jgi:hypothetical protein
MKLYILSFKIFQIQVGAIITPITDDEVSKSTVETFFGTPVITPETPKKRVYLKRVRLQSFETFKSSPQFYQA